MNTELLSLVAVGGSGSALLAGIAAHEYAQAEKMRASRVQFRTRYPLGLEAAQLSAAWDALAGLPYTAELVAEVVASEGSITHGLLVPQAVLESVRSTLVAVVPSLRVTEAPASPHEPVTLSLRLFVSTPSLFSTDNPGVASRSLLSGLANLRERETVVVRWALSAGSPRSRREPENPTPHQREIARAWAAKTATKGLRVSGLVLIRAATKGLSREGYVAWC